MSQFTELAYSYYGLFAVVGLSLALIYAFGFSQPAFPKGAPKLVSDSWPLVGSYAFFTKRWDFFRQQIAHSSTGQFSFYVGRYPVIGLSGEEGRKAFFESRQLNFTAGYSTLLAGGPKTKANDGNTAESDQNEFSGYFQKRLMAMLKRHQFDKNLPVLISDTKARLDELAADPSGVTDPFDSIYRIVYQLTMRTVAANEIANDRALLDKTLKLYESIENASTPWLIMFPHLPTPAKLQQAWSGAQLYKIFANLVEERRKTGRRDDDALQYLIDQGDDTLHIITFVLGSLFAGQLNSGINAAWVLTYLAASPYWLQKCQDEISAVAEKYDPDTSKPLADRLTNVPLEAWETEFPIIDLCLRDSIRLQAVGTGFRKNTSNTPVPVGNGKEVIPPGSYAAYALADVHLDPNIYPNPEQWDPSRYLPDKAEDKKVSYGFLGWGVARHPCLGMRFAKLEQNIITAFFLAYFDVSVCDSEGGPRMGKLPVTDKNRFTAHKPSEKVYLRYEVKGK